MRLASPPEAAAAPAGALRCRVPLEALLPQALARLRRQKQYASALQKGGRRALAVEDWLAQAAACVSALARPEMVLMPVASEAAPDGVRIAGRVTLEGADLDAQLAEGTEFTAYLVTLGYDQPAAFGWLGGDYAIHHVQSDLGSEVLFALGRHAHARHRELCPGKALRRVPVQAADLCGTGRSWDPARVQRLLEVFAEENPGVSVTPEGCFQPLNSLLGLTLAR